MERPFWTTGAVPFALLDRLALPRPDAMHEILAELEKTGVAHIGGAPGSGRSTLAHQCAAGLGKGAVILDARAVETQDPEVWLRHVVGALGLRRGGSWSQVSHALRAAGDPLLILDAPSGGAEAMAATIHDNLSGHPAVIVGDDGVVPERIDDRATKTFLAERMRPYGIEWSTAGLRQAAQIVDGHPDLLQWIGQAILTVTLTGSSRDVDEETVLEGATLAAHHLPAQHALPVSRLKGARLALVKAMARAPAATPTDWANHVGLPPRSVPVHMGRLVTEGLVVREGRGTYRLRSPLVQLHLRSRYGSPVQQVSGRRVAPASA